MGRKGAAGGTAGGGRSGSRGNVTYSRVIPKFLQRLADPESTRNPLDAKRTWATEHVKERRPRDEIDRNSERQRNPDPENEIEGLEAQGFNVVTEAHRETQRGEEKNGSDTDGRTKAAARGNGDKLQISGGIEKKSKRPANPVGKAFDLKNRHKLSFAESESESE